MTCKSHVLILVLALLALAPDDLHVWQSLPDTVHPTMGADIGATLAGAATHPHGHYRCGLGMMAALVVGTGFFGFLTALVYVIGRALRTARIARTPGDEILPGVAATALRHVIRIHMKIATLGYVAMIAAFGVESYGYGLLLAFLATVVLSRAGTCRNALDWLEHGASVERRAEIVIVTTPKDVFAIRASKRIFRAAERIALPTASLHTKPHA